MSNLKPASRNIHLSSDLRRLLFSTSHRTKWSVKISWALGALPFAVAGDCRRSVRQEGRGRASDGGPPREDGGFVKVGDTVVNEELIREGLARVFTRYRDRAICEQWRRLEDGREQRSGDCEQRRMRSPRGSFGKVGDHGEYSAIPPLPSHD